MVGSFFQGDDGFGFRGLYFGGNIGVTLFFFSFPSLPFYVVRVSFPFVQSIDKILSIA